MNQIGFTSQTRAPRILLTTMIVLLSTPVFAEWTFDFSRRTTGQRQREMVEAERSPASVPEGAAAESSGASLLTSILGSSGDSAQEIVILNTERGFIPSSVRIRMGLKYTFHIVNVNEKEKNVSFIMDAFSQSHSTYFGKIKSFQIESKKEGVFSFQSPESGFEGKLVVLSPPPQIRTPASEGK